MVYTVLFASGLTYLFVALIAASFLGEMFPEIREVWVSIVLCTVTTIVAGPLLFGTSVRTALAMVIVTNTAYRLSELLEVVLWRCKTAAVTPQRPGRR